MHRAFYDSVQHIVWVVQDSVVTHSADAPNQGEAAAQLRHWGFWMVHWERPASGLGYRSPRLETAVTVESVTRA